MFEPQPLLLEIDSLPSTADSGVDDTDLDLCSLYRVAAGDVVFVSEGPNSFFPSSVIAKAAKKSVKRFGGILELFTALEAVIKPGRGKGLPVLMTAVSGVVQGKNR